MSTVIGTTAQAAWDLVYRVSPIILTGGIASSASNSLSITGLFGSVFNSLTGLGIPIATILDPLGLLTNPTSIINGSLSTDDLFAHFEPIPGGTVLDFESAKFPFANQSVAANAMIQKELTISLHMECAYRNANSIVSRIATLQAMQATLTQHVVQGGTFTVLTPGAIYSNALLLRITDVTPDPTMPQTAFQWDFEQPLITTAAAAGASSTLMSKLLGGQQASGNWIDSASSSGAGSTTGSLF